MDDIIIYAAAAVFAVLVIIGFVRRIKKGETTDMVTDTVVNEVKRIVVREITNVLNGAGLANDYESFKQYVIKSLLKKARAYFDEKGGTIDDVTDAISDEAIIDAINTVITMSGIEQDIKASYDSLVSARLQEIDDSENEVEEENNKLENEDLEQYEDSEEESNVVEEEPVVTVDEE